jgi:nucleoside phosphorylase
LLAAGIPAARGAGLTVDRIVIDAREKLSFGDASGAAAVDMETFDIWSACANAGLPFAALRTVSDEAGCDLPDFNRAHDATGRVDAARMAAAMLARPVAATRFLANLRPVMRSFRRGLKAVLDAPLA